MTQRGIKQALTERYYSWEDARVLALTDPEVNMSGKGPAYNPSDMVEEDAAEEISSKKEEISSEKEDVSLEKEKEKEKGAQVQTAT